MSKIQNLIDAHKESEAPEALARIERYVAKDAVTAWAKRVGNAYLDSLKDEGTPVEGQKTASTPTVKAERVVNPHTALRKQAWDWRKAEFDAGRKVTLAEAYERFGTASAGVQCAVEHPELIPA